MERKWWTLVAVCMATFMLLLDITVVNIALPEIRRDLGANLTDLQWVVDAYTLALSALILTAGTLSDLFGRRRLFIIGVVVFSAASLLCGLATSPLFLHLARGLQGVGGAAMFATALALIAQEFQGPERGTAIAYWGSTVGGAVAIGPLVGGAITEALGWEWIFFVNVPIGALAVIIARTRSGESKDPEARHVDWAGTITFSGGLFALTYGLLRGNDEGWGSSVIVASFAIAAVLLVAFFVVEAVQKRPMFDLALFRKPAFDGVSAGTFAIGAGMFAMFLYLTLYIQNVLGYSPLQAGLRFLPITLFAFIVPLATRGLTARIPARVTLGSGLACVGLGLLLMRGVSPDSTWTDLLPGFMVAGFGIGLSNPSIASTALAVVPPARSGMASGISNNCRLTGVTTGIAALGAIFESQIESKLGKLLPGKAGLSEAVASGGNEALSSAGASPHVVNAGKQAFVFAFDEILLVGALVLFAGSLVVFALVRQSDLVPHGAPQPVPAEAG